MAALWDMAGRTCVITGGAGYLGRAMADIYREAGARVVLLDVGFDEPPSDTQTTHILCDLTEAAAVEAAVSAVLDVSATIDVLVHNAAFVGSSAKQGWNAPFEHQTADHYRMALEVNLVAPFLLTQRLLPALRASGRGSVIMVGSIYGHVGPDWGLYEDTPLGNPAGYAASKGGLMQLTRWLATTLAPEVRVNAFSPGGIERGQDKTFQTRYLARTPMGRMASVQDFKGVALFLASDMSAYITGQVIPVDGGWTAW